MDIDKVSLLGYIFKNGKLVTWSPYFLFDTTANLVASETLPFPTGNRLENSQILDEMFNNLVQRYQSAQNTASKIIIIGKLIRRANELGYIPTNNLEIVGIINKHNTFFNRKSRKNALINFVSTKMYNISSDPRNLIQGLSGIDDAVTPVKKKAALLDMHIKSKSFAPGSPQSKLSQLILTLSGKENTGIVASAMKNFEACSLHYYTTLAKGTPELLKRLLMLVNVLGKECKLLANAYAANLDNVDDEVLDALLEVDNVLDIFLQFSALLSLSTDNAKDPTLAKINAGPKMMSLFTAGLMIGIDLNTLIDIMTSRTAWEINGLLKSNIFNDTLGIFNIDGIFTYLLNGPISYFKLLYDGTKKEIAKCVNAYINKTEGIREKSLSLNEVYRILLNPRFDLIKALKVGDDYKGESNSEVEKQIAKNQLSLIKSDLDENLKTIDKLKTKENRTKLEDKKLKKLEERLKILIKLQVALNDLIFNTTNGDVEIRNDLELKIINEAENVLDIAEHDIYDDFSWENKGLIKFSRFKKALAKYKSFKRLTLYETIESPFDGQKYSVIVAIKTLSHVANEQARLRPVLGLNQSLPNDLASLLKILRNFEEIFVQRLSESPNEDFVERFSNFNGGSLLIDLNKFVSDYNYRQDIIKYYDEIKAAVNIFDVMENSHHYFGYLKALNMLIETCKYTSTVYNTANHVSANILNKYFKVASNAKLHEKYIKRVQKFVHWKLNNLFLLSRNVIINMPLDYIFLSTGKKLKGSESKSIILGTPAGNASFKYWMELVVFNDLKSKYANKLIQDLTPLNISKTFDGNAERHYALSANMMPKSDSERSIFKLYKDSLNRLQSITYNNIPVLDLLFYYNIIAFNMQSGQNSLTSLFEDIFAEKSNDTVTSYIEFYSRFDKEGQFEENVDYTEDELLLYIAPNENVELGKLKYIRAYNPDEMRIVMLVQKESTRDDDSLDFDYLDDIIQDQLELILQESDDFLLDFDDFAENGGITDDFINRLQSSNYVIFDGDGVDSMPKYFTNNYFSMPNRLSLSGNISLKDLDKSNIKIIINRQTYSATQLLQLANLNGHSINDINDIIYYKIIRSPEGKPTRIIDVDRTLSNITQIMELNC